MQQQTEKEQEGGRRRSWAGQKQEGPERESLQDGRWWEEGQQGNHCKLQVQREWK